MNLNDSQKLVHSYIQKLNTQYWHPLSNLARLVEEVGELARQINHSYGQKIKKSSENYHHISEEIGDILFTLICIANSQNVDLHSTLKKTILKYQNRDHDRWSN